MAQRFPSHFPRVSRKSHHLPKIRTGCGKAQHLLQQPPVPLHPLSQREPLPALGRRGGHRGAAPLPQRRPGLFIQGCSLVEGARAPGPAAPVRGELGASGPISPGCRHPPEPQGAGRSGVPPIQQPVRQVRAELRPRLPRRPLRPRFSPPGPRLFGRGALRGGCGGARPPSPLLLQRLDLALQDGVGAAGGLGALRPLLGGPRQAPNFSGSAPLHESCGDKTRGVTPALPSPSPEPSPLPPEGTWMTWRGRGQAVTQPEATQGTDTLPASLGSRGGAAAMGDRCFPKAGAHPHCSGCPGAPSRESRRERALPELNQGPEPQNRTETEQKSLPATARPRCRQTDAGPCSAPAPGVTRGTRSVPSSPSRCHPGAAALLHPAGSILAPLDPMEEPRPWPGLQQHPRDSPRAPSPPGSPQPLTAPG